MINWKIRMKNKIFWLSIIPAILLIAQIVTGWFGIDLAADFIGAEAEKFVNAVFSVLVILGIVTDPTVKGASDSKRALRYSEPKDDKKYLD